MFLHIDSTNGIPIYEQIARQIKFAIANDSLKAGEHVPSVREMAALAAVNPNTVSRTYRELQLEGILTPIRGTGLAVTPEAKQICRQVRQNLIRERLGSVITEALQNQFTVEEILQLVESEIQQAQSQLPKE